MYDVTGQTLFIPKMNNKSNFRDWGGMGKDLILRIFLSLGIMDVIRCGSVCRSWREASSNTELWKSIDLTKVGSEIFFQSRSGHIAIGIWNTLFSHGRDISCLIFNYYFYMKDRHLIRVSQRYCLLSPEVLKKKVVLFLFEGIHTDTLSSLQNTKSKEISSTSTV